MLDSNIHNMGMKDIIVGRILYQGKLSYLLHLCTARDGVWCMKQYEVPLHHSQSSSLTFQPISSFNPTLKLSVTSFVSFSGILIVCIGQMAFLME